jgi:recombination protein RecT
MAITKESAKNAASASTGLVKKKLADFENLLMPYQIKVAQIAPKKGLQADRILRMAATTIWMNEKLHECDPKSMLMAVMQLAMAGINPQPQFREAYLIPYGRECQMQLAYLGIIKLCEKSAMIKAIWAEAVYEGDFYEEIKGTNPSIVHREGPNYGDASKFIRAYAVVEKMSGGKQSKSLNKTQIERLRMKNKMQNNQYGTNPRGAWESDYDQMALAKVLKAVLKTVPMEDEYRSALFLDEQIASTDNFDSFDGVSPIRETYPDEPREGSAEVVPETPAAETPPATDAEIEAEFKKQAERENLFNQGKP